MKPLQLTPESAQKLAEALHIPLEQLMHMPKGVLMQKMMEMAKQENKE